jgi:hypothetical protein
MFEAILFNKQFCHICRHNMPKSKLKEYVTIQGNKIICCERCSGYIKFDKKEKYT